MHKINKITRKELKLENKKKSVKKGREQEKRKRNYSLRLKENYSPVK